MIYGGCSAFECPLEAVEEEEDVYMPTPGTEQLRRAGVFVERLAERVLHNGLVLRGHREPDQQRQRDDTIVRAQTQA